MRQVCPYEINGHCKRLNKSCQPGLKGCILKGKVKFLELGEEDSSPNQKNLKEKLKKLNESQSSC